MLARSLNVLINGVACTATAVVVLVVGAACKDAEAPLELYQAFASGANVIPAPASHADSSVRASISVVISSDGLVGYAYSVFSAPSTTIDLVALYQAAAEDTLPAIATAVLCDGAEACAVRGGYATVVPPATVATIQSAIRADSMEVVFFTTTAPNAAGGVMRGTMHPYQP